MKPLFTRKEKLQLLAILVGGILATVALMWLIWLAAPWLIMAVVFIPWLLAALKDGANVK